MNSWSVLFWSWPLEYNSVGLSSFFVSVHLDSLHLPWSVYFQRSFNTNSYVYTKIDQYDYRIPTEMFL